MKWLKSESIANSLDWIDQITYLLQVDFGSESQSRMPDFYTTSLKKSPLKSTLLDFKSGKSDLDSTPPRRSDP